MLDFKDKRLITDPEGAEYTNMSVTKFREWAEQIGAVRRIGRARRNDKKIIDQFLDGVRLDGCKGSTENRYTDC